MCSVCYHQCWPNGQCSACGFWEVNLPEPKAEPKPETEPEPQPPRAPARKINMFQVDKNTWVTEALPNLWDWVEDGNWSCIYEKFLEWNPQSVIITDPTEPVRINDRHIGYEYDVYFHKNNYYIKKKYEGQDLVKIFASLEEAEKWVDSMENF